MKTILKAILVSLIGLLLVSCGTKSTSPEDGQVATPVFSTEGGTYESAIDILISCTTPQATIRFTTDNTEPTSSSMVFSEVLHLSTNTTLKAKAFKSGWIASSTNSANYVFSAVAAPVIDPPGALYETPQTISMSCETPLAQIRWTSDGTIPTQAANLYTAPIIISTSKTVKAVAFLADKMPSPVSSETYTLQVQAPVFSPQGGSFSTPQMVSISCSTADVQIAYTLDGSLPTEASSIYTHPLNINSNTIVTARAFKSGWNPSIIKTSPYQINVADQMVLVNAGSFHNGFSNVALSSFYISRYEVTQFDWLVIMGTDPSFYPETEEGVFTDLPVESISWFKAIEYCNRRSINEGFIPCYNYGGQGTNPDNWTIGWDQDSNGHTSMSCNWNANGYRLPTEMEWMFAASGGNNSQSYLYSGSNNADAVAWITSNSESSTHSVGLKLANELGLYDMSGNVWEYCWDIYNPYPTTDQTNPTGATNGNVRAMRGGSCLHDASNCTVARRYYSYAAYANNITGFRVARKGQ